MVCHEEYFGNGENHYHKSPEANLAFIKSGATTALDKLREHFKDEG